MDTIEDLIASQDRLITVREAADLLRVSIVSLRRWDKSGQLRAARTPGGYRRYRLSDIRRLQGVVSGPGCPPPPTATS
jgi:excisionase family DNA binding protein